jgi:hypothetical protein
MNIWIIMLLIFGAGAIGGIVNAVVTDNGFILPKKVDTNDGMKTIRPGIIGNILISGIAGLLSMSAFGGRFGVETFINHPAFLKMIYHGSPGY